MQNFLFKAPYSNQLPALYLISALCGTLIVGVLAIPSARAAREIEAEGYLQSPLPVPGKEIALVFDDGPTPWSTPIILENLKKLRIRATFSLVGKNVSTYPELAKRIVADGHEVANRTWSNLELTGMTPEQIRSEIKADFDIIYKITGVKPRFFRPPGSKTNPEIEDIASSAGMTVLMHSLDSGDWRNPPDGTVKRVVLTGVTPCAIILAHESFPKFIKELPAILEGLSTSGYQLLTVSELQSKAGIRFAGHAVYDE